jgi:hypothetical protein
LFPQCISRQTSGYPQQSSGGPDWLDYCWSARREYASQFPVYGPSAAYVREAASLRVGRHASPAPSVPFDSVSAHSVLTRVFKNNLWGKHLACPGSRDGRTTKLQSNSWTSSYARTVLLKALAGRSTIADNRQGRQRSRARRLSTTESFESGSSTRRRSCR